MMKRLEKEDIEFQFVSDFGMTVELYTKNKSLNAPYPLIKVYADEESETLYAELATENGLFQIPLESLKQMISLSETEAHSESWFNEHVFKDSGST